MNLEDEGNKCLFHLILDDDYPDRGYITDYI
jgi:hypothetical protein